MKVAQDYPYVVIGAGSGGLTMAVGLHKLGKKALLVSENIGGECTFSGCVPSKSLLKETKKFRLSQNEPKREEATAEVFANVREIVAQFAVEDEEVAAQIPKILGRAEFVDKQTVVVNNQRVRFKKCVIATGSKPVMVKIKGVGDGQLLTNENVFELKNAPRSLTIVGGGPIGCEMATAFADLGTKVQIVTRGKILPKDSEAAVSLVRASLLKKGVLICEDTEIVLVADGKVLLNDGRNLEASEYYLIALGRVANTKMGLEKAGVEFGKNGIAVDERFRTSQNGIWAIGDCTTSPKFTHLAYYQATKVITQQINGWLPKGKVVLPWVTFTQPAIAAVGVNSESARVKRFVIPFMGSDRAKIEREEELYGEMYVDGWSGRIVGATLVGEHAEHLINFYTLAVLQQTRVWKLLDLITPYPTYASAMNKVATESTKWWAKRLPQTVKEVVLANWSRIAVVLFWIIAAIVLYNILKSYYFDVVLIAQELYTLLQSPFGVLFFIVLYCLRPLISFSATVLSIVAGSVYGFGFGLLLTIVASNLSSVVAYYLGRSVFGLKNAQQNSGLVQRLSGNTFQSTLTARLTYLPYDLVSYIAGALKAPLLPFIGATVLGSIPGSVAIVAFGASIENLAMVEDFRLDPWYILVGLMVLALSFVIRRILK